MGLPSEVAVSDKFCPTTGKPASMDHAKCSRLVLETHLPTSVMGKDDGEAEESTTSSPRTIDNAMYSSNLARWGFPFIQDHSAVQRSLRKLS
jgi:hypothetical protein